MALVHVVAPLLALSGTARAACDEPAELVAQVEQAVLDARFEDARAATDRAERAFGCTGSAEGALLARLWVAEGAMAHVEGDPAARDQAFASAQRVAPGQWTEAFGAALESLWAAAAAQPRSRGTLQVEGLAPGQGARVDGRPVQTPAELESGLYLVQADGGPPLFTRIVLLPDEQTLVVRVEPQAPATAAPTAGRDHRGRGWWFAGAGVAAALSGTSAWLATRQDGAMEGATSIDELDGDFGRQKGFGYATWGLAGLGAACVGVGIAW
ncbi:hypothetical protein L6R53_15620 [Myxococcota bacterium]|nr:hypothetical protein [Myxococcota bacterium]